MTAPYPHPRNIRPFGRQPRGPHNTRGINPMADTSAGKGATAASTSAADAPATFHSIMTEHRRSTALRLWALTAGEFDEGERKQYGVTADGTIADGGLTAAGAKFADEIAEQVDEVGEMHAGKKRQRASRPRTLDGSLGEVLDSLALRGPIRAALRAGAQALAASLNDGEADDEGLERDGEGEGAADVSVVRIVGPFVILQAQRLPGVPVGVISVASGGGLTHESDAEGASMTVERMIELAADGVRVNRERASKGEKNAAVMTGGAGLSGEQRSAAAEAVRNAFGTRVDVVDLADLREQSGTEAETRLYEKIFGAGEPAASGGGPSTEEPAMPNMPPVRRDEPASDPGEPATSDTPSEDAPPSVPDEAPSGDNGGGSSSGE